MTVDKTISVLEIISLVGEGLDYEAIIKKCPQLNHKDINQAIIQGCESLLKLDILENIFEVDDCFDKLLAFVKKVSETRDRNHEGWTDEEDHEILKLFSYNAKIPLIARLLNRSELTIITRINILKKMNRS